jgi:branched-chain amino acid transport system substrate-binding protein
MEEKVVRGWSRGVRWLTVSALATAAITVAACGSDDSATGTSTPASGNSAKASSVKVAVILDETGQAGFAGALAKKGFEQSLKEINDAGGANGTKIEAEYADSATDIKEATTLGTKYARDKDVSAIVFGTQGAEALAIAPIAQREGVPLVALYSGGPGVVETGDHIFRVTAPQKNYTHLEAEYLKNKGVKTISLVYNDDSPTLQELGTKVWPQLAQENGLQVVSSTKTSQATTDFSSFTSEVTNKKPDAVVLLLAGAANVTAITGIQRAGYKGMIAGQPGIAGAILKPLGAKADGITYPIDFSVETTAPVGKKFVATFGADANTYSASGYDAALMIAEGVKNAKDTSRDGMLAGLTAAAGTGFEGASGQLTFKNRDASVPGVLIQWEGGKETVIQP